MIRTLLLSIALVFAISLALAQDVPPQQLGVVPGAGQYSLVKTPEKCVAGTAFSIGGSESLGSRFAIVKEVSRGNSIFVLDPRAAAIPAGQHSGKVIWVMKDSSKHVIDAVFISNGKEDLTYYFTHTSANLFPKAKAVGFHVGAFLQGYDLRGAMQAAKAVNQCATK